MAERALHALGEVPEWIPVRDELGRRSAARAEVDAYRRTSSAARARSG